jgi:hypothetical protein
LVYEADAVLPPEIYLESAGVAQFSEADQDEARELDANLMEEKYNKALANMQKYQEFPSAITINVLFHDSWKLGI